MTSLCAQQVVNVLPDHLPIQGLHRVIWLDSTRNRVVLLAVDQTKRSHPKSLALNLLQEHMEQGHLIAVSVKPDPRTLMSDEQLRISYPPRRPDQESFVLTYRERWWRLIEPIISQSSRYFQGEVSLNELVAQRASETGVSRQSIFAVLYKYWAGGSNKSVLLPNTSRCGGKGKARVGSGKPLGRKPRQIPGSNNEVSRYPMTQAEVENLRLGWRNHLRKGVTVEDAYRKTMEDYYCEEWRQEDGALRVDLKPADQRPSLRQFCYHGLRQEGGLMAWRMHLTEHEYLLNHRPLDGRPSAGLGAIGQVAQADASTNDVHLVSTFDRTRIVGPCHHILIVDEFTGLIVGFSVAWSVDATAAKLALLNAASSKVDLCARYGITITDELWPRAVFAKLVGDRGEFNCAEIYQACDALCMSLQIVQSGRGDAKGLVEGKHHSVHALVSHKLPGTTRGRRRGRGEPEPALDACLDIDEYTGELVRAIIHHNTKAPVPARLTVEMQRDGVAPTRIAIWNWARQRGYVGYTNCDEDRLITTLCPPIDAVVDADGVHLISPRSFNSGDEVVVMRLRYLGEVARIRGWLETARRRGRHRIEVFHNPCDLRRIWYLDAELGLQPLDLVTSDAILAKGGVNLHDLLFAQCHLSLAGRQQREVDLQGRIELAVARENTVAKARSDLRLIASSDASGMGKKASKAKRLADRRSNRSREVGITGKVVLPLAADSSRTAPARVLRLTSAVQPAEADPDSRSPAALEQWLTEDE